MAGFCITGAVVAIGEACMDGGEIAVEAEPGKRLVRDGQLDVLASARPAGRGYRLVAVKRRLAGEIEYEECTLELETRQWLRSHSNLVPGRFWSVEAS